MQITKAFIDRPAKFVCYKDGELWYTLVGGDPTFDGPNSLLPFDFPVPIKDTGTGVFKAEHKGIELMRWVRKYMETQKEWKHNS